jgi:protein-ribulosamine 3-kinase
VSSRELIRDVLSLAGVDAADDFRWESAGSSSFHQTCRVQHADRRYFLKHNVATWPGHFESEAAGLRALAGVETSLVIPQVFAFADGGACGSFLLMEFLEVGRADDAWAEELGRGLAELHEPVANEDYGFVVDGYCGSTPQPNPRCRSWVEFYGQHRLAQLAVRAKERGLDHGTLRRLDQLVDRLDEWIGEPEGPCLIHGDLWSGNAMALTDGCAALVDPAAHYGEREAELGMMSLFGGFSPRTWAAYQESRPLRPGWRHRLGLYQLYHRLNHYVLFGGSYATDADRTIRQYVG